MLRARITLSRRRLSAVALCLWFFGCLAPAPVHAQPTEAISNEVRLVRMQLQARRLALSPEELDRLADLLGRSNFVTRMLPQAINSRNVTNTAHLLDMYPGKIDDLNFFGEPPAVLAARQNDVAMLNLLIERKADLDRTGRDGMTAFEAALQSGRWSAATRLIEAGAGATHTNSQGQTPLALTIGHWRWYGPRGENPDDSRMGLVNLLLGHGADSFAPAGNRSSSSIVEEALAEPDPALGDLLLTNHPSVRRLTPMGDTALQLAVIWGRTNDIDFLISSGFSMEQTNSDGLTLLQELVGVGPQGALLHRASLSRFVSVPPPLIRTMPPRTGPVFASRPNFIRSATPANAPMGMADVLLTRGATLDAWSAAGMGRTNELSALLLANPTLANARDGFGRTPLHYAVIAAMSLPAAILPGPTATTPISPQYEAARSLILAGADPSLSTTKPITGRLASQMAIPAGTSPLHLASLGPDASLTELLLRAGARAAQPDDNGDTPLHLAAGYAGSNTVALLLKAHAPLNATNHSGQTPLRAAVEAGSVPNFKFLLEAGARPEIGLASNTLLHIAAAQGNAEFVRLLLMDGLALEARDSEGYTPFQRAVQARQWATLNLLWGKGASVNTANALGNTSLHELAAEQQQDAAWHMTEQTWYDRTGQSWLTTPGVRKSVLTNLINWKWLSAPAQVVWTNTSLIAWLTAHKANPNLTNRQGKTPLQLLLGQEWLTYDSGNGSNRVEALLNAGASIDLPDAEGLTSIHLAASNAPPAILSLLARRAGKLDAMRDRLGRTPLHLAALSLTGHDQSYVATNVALLLGLGASPTVRDNEGLTPLHLAITNRHGGRLEAARLLLQHGADPNARDSQGRTPLHLLAQALRNGDYFPQASETLDLLLDSGADASLRDNEDQTFLHRLCEQGRNHSANLDSTLRQLIQKHHELLNVTNAGGETLLHAAVRANDYPATQLLVQSGADPLVHNAKGESALYLAQENDSGGFSSVVRPKGMGLGFRWSIAARNKADFDAWLQAEPKLASVTFKNGETALRAATEPGVPRPFAERLLELGAPLDVMSALQLDRMDDVRRLITDGRDCPTNFWFEAVRLNRFEQIEDLIATHGDVRALDHEGHTLLYRALATRQRNVAEWLRAQGVTESFPEAVRLGDTNSLTLMLATNRSLANTPQTNGDTPLMLAARTARRDSARILIAHGADIHAVNPFGWTPFYLACAFGTTGVAEELVAAGANPNGDSSGQIAPLHFCAADGVEIMARFLLDHGVDPNLRQAKQQDDPRSMPAGATPLHWAANWGRPDVAQLLLERGANVNATNVAGETPLDLVRVNPSIPKYQLSVPGLPLNPRAADQAWEWAEIEKLLIRAGGVRRVAAPPDKQLDKHLDKHDEFE